MPIRFNKNSSKTVQKSWYLDYKKKSSNKFIQKWATIGGKKYYYKSRWEVNYARYLQWLKSIGQIKDWDYEPEVFWFEKIKRGVRSYLPDFRIIDNHGKKSFVEVKGYMDSKSKTKIKRMATYYPHITLNVLDKKQYYILRAKFSRIVPGWE